MRTNKKVGWVFITLCLFFSIFSACDGGGGGAGFISSLVSSSSTSSSEPLDNVSVIDNLWNSSTASAGDVGAGNFTTEGARPSMAIQSDGSIVVVGNKYVNANANEISVKRYLSSGAVDTNFGISGEATVALGGLATNNLPCGVLIQPDGKIVLSFFANTNGDGNIYGYLARLDSLGSLDTSFGNLDGEGQGFVYITNTVSVTNNKAHGSGSLQSIPDNMIWSLDNEILVIVAGGDSSSFIVKINPTNGSYDQSFGNTQNSPGVALLDSSTYFAFGFTQMPNVSGGTMNGDILVAGANSSNAVVWALDSSSANPDTNFASSGEFVKKGTAGGSEDVANNIIASNSGAIYVSGYSDDTGTNQRTTVWKLTQTGRLDTSFNSHGYFVDTNNIASVDLPITMQLFGSVLLVTGGFYDSNSNYTAALAISLDATAGTLKTSFSGDGYFHYAPSAFNNYAYFVQSEVGSNDYPVVLVDDNDSDSTPATGDLQLVEFTGPQLR